MSLGKKLKEIYGDRNITVLVKFTEECDGYIQEQAKNLFIDMKKIEAVKDRNQKFRFQTQMKTNIKLFLKEIFDNIIPSPNLVAFYTAVELDILIAKFLGTEIAFEKEVQVDDKLKNDYKTMTSQLRESITLKLPQKLEFSKEVVDSWNSSTKYLGKMIMRMFKYNEFMYNHDHLVELLENTNESFSKKYDLEFKNSDFIDEKNVCKEIYYRFFIIQDLVEGYKENLKELLPDDFDKDMKYLKTTITKLKKSLELTKIELESKIPPKPKTENKYQKYSGMNLKHWKSMEAR